MTMMIFRLMTKKESELSRTVSRNSGAHTLKDNKMIKSPFNKNNY